MHRLGIHSAKISAILVYLSERTAVKKKTEMRITIKVVVQKKFKGLGVPVGTVGLIVRKWKPNQSDSA